jgi:hypothetical protein
MISDDVEGRKGRRNEKFEIIVEIGRWCSKRVLTRVVCQRVWFK